MKNETNTISSITDLKTESVLLVENDELLTNKIDDNELLTNKTDDNELLTNKTDDNELLSKKADDNELLTKKADTNEITTEKADDSNGFTNETNTNETIAPDEKVTIVIEDDLVIEEPVVNNIDKHYLSISELRRIRRTGR